MAHAPQLDINMDAKRLFLADLNGTGCADLVYVDAGRVHFWFNQSGNRWSAQQTILGTPTVTDADSLQFADVFGTGTATLVWSYDYAGQPEGHYRHAVDYETSIPRAGRRQSGGNRPHQQDKAGHHIQVSPRLF
jgi:hypothetical protein